MLLLSGRLIMNHKTYSKDIFKVYCSFTIGEVTVGGNEVKQPKGHFTKDSKPKDFDVDQIFVSPSIKYSGCSVYAKPKRYIRKFVHPVHRISVYMNEAQFHKLELYPYV